MKETIVCSLPDCDVCKMKGLKSKANYDAKTTINGSWGFLCENCFAKYGVGLGTGKGQKLIVKE